MRFGILEKPLKLTPACRDPLTDRAAGHFIDYVYSPRSTADCKFVHCFIRNRYAVGEALGLRWCDCNFDEGIISVTHTIMYKRCEDGNYRYRISSPKTEAVNREIPMLDDVKAALLREKDKATRNARKSFVVDGFSDFVF